MKKWILGSISAIFLLTGCATGSTCCQNTISQVNNDITPENLVNSNNNQCFVTNPASVKQCTCSNCILKVEVKGVGTTPTDAVTTAQAQLMARRAAILDGYKALVEKLYGIKINSRDTMKNMILQSSVLRAYVEGLIRGANIEDESFKNGIYTVTMSVKVNLNEWNSFLKNRNYNVINDF
jgi:hypothetical protein